MPSGLLYEVALQYGKETTPGTSVPATRVAYGSEAVFGQTSDIELFKPATGTRDNSRGVIVGASQVQGSLSMPLSSSEILEILDIGVKGGGVITTPGGGTTTRLHTYVPGALYAATFEWMDGKNPWEIAGCYADTIEIDLDVQGQVMVNVGIFGTGMVAAALTGSLAQRTPDFFRGWEAKVYIDNLGATPGTTEIPCVVTAANISYSNNLGRVFAANNSRAACAVNPGEIDLTVSLTMRAAQATALTEFTAFQAGTQRLVRLSFGNNTVLEGSLYKFVTLDIPGAWTAVDLGANGQGERLYQFTGSYVYDAVNAFGFQVRAQNNRAAVWA
jgi:hypothetical protein